MKDMGMPSPMDTTATIDRTATETPKPTRSVEQRIERLSTASLKRVIEPDTEVPGHVRDGQILPDELISLATVPELFDQLTPEQKATLSREEFASITDTGIRA